KANEPRPFGLFPELLLEGFDREQIWEQLQLRNAPLRRYVARKTKELGRLTERAEAARELEDEEEETEEEEEEDGLDKTAVAESVREDAVETASDIEKLDDDDVEEETASEGLGEAETADGSASGGSEMGDDVEEGIHDARPSVTESGDGAAAGARATGSVVDDDFFSLAEMERFTEEAEREEAKRNAEDEEDEEDSENDEGEDEIDYFADPDTLVDEESEGEDAKDLTYNDFFDPPKRQADAAEGRSRKRAKIDDAEEDSQTEDSEEECQVEDADVRSARSKALFAAEKGETTEVKSAEEVRSERLAAKIAYMEEEAVQDKHWTMKGEAGARQRPLNSLLEEDLEFDHAARVGLAAGFDRLPADVDDQQPARACRSASIRVNHLRTTLQPVPVITQEMTESLEEMVKRRIADHQFDSVLRKADPDAKEFRPSSRVYISDEKSKKSLAEIYEDEYVAKTTGVQQVDERDAAMVNKHEEIDSLMSSLFTKLDALSNFHFTPKMPKTEFTVKANVPAISMEEAIPVAVSDGTLLAPEEVYKPRRTHRKSKSRKP
ncbi:MAG: U3 small nucleolar ribonucleoprotein complex, subunit Mpp10, partial [Olpidium bornovanus]